MPYLLALAPLLLLIALLGFNVSIYGTDSLEGANQLALLFATALAIIIGIQYGSNWLDIIRGIRKSISSTTSSIIILLLIGALTGTWLISGIVPAMVYYGLQILNPQVFLFASCIICAIVSLATGSSWSTIATIGIALLGIGKALGISEGLIAGSIISGAYFGDKMSPMSDTTNLAPAMAGTDLFTHIRYMMYTTIPSFIITLTIFLVFGFYSTITTQEDVHSLMLAISTKFDINYFLFLPPIIVIFLIVKRIPPIPALFTGVLLGGIFAIFFQPHIIADISGIKIFSFRSGYIAVINAMANDISIITENKLINELFFSGGMSGMLNTIWLIICAMAFGGAIEATNILTVISQPVVKRAESTGSLIATTSGTCIFFNLATSDQYLSIVVPGRMFADTYKEKRLAAENLSRTLEDSGTVTSVLIPWNTCGATQAGILGIATFTYLPYCFFNLISPIMTILYGYFNIKIRKSILK